jgi:hypothetical protein
VAQVNGVAVTSAEATLMSQMNGANVLASASLPANATAGSQTIITGSTAGTLTLPASTAQASSVCYVKNISTAIITVAAGSSTTVNYNGTTGSFLLGPNTGASFILIGTVWYVIGYDGLGQQTNYNSVTANYTNQPAVTSTWYSAAATSGTAPSITLPNDGRTYRIVFTAPFWKCATASLCLIGVGTSTTNILSTTQQSIGTVSNQIWGLSVESLVSSGQTVSVYTQNTAGNGSSYLITVEATTGASGIGPSTIAAYRVA